MHTNPNPPKLNRSLHSLATLFSRRSLADRVDVILPQTQCRQCGYEGCRPYAEAVARGEADINRCPPGGETGIRRIARLMGREPIPVDPDCGQTKPKQIAWIDENACIGCTLCIQACPVDAIHGAAKQMHTVISTECTGCELCLPPCPVDCIHMHPAPETGAALAGLLGKFRRQQNAKHFRERHQKRLQRLQAERRQKGRRPDLESPSSQNQAGDDPRKAAIQAAIERTRAKKSALSEKPRA